ncbi:MAG: GTP 3',8-cyclase MoaA [Chthoniobacterales bacterium]|nr:GTP 3',8-cyclase MoaA [Chthoniobacterales bacterium]
MKDPFNRSIDYLRISVTDRCNEKCLYCMPEGYKGWAQRSDHMSAEEILRTVRAAADLGFKKFRVTGGEPLLRKDIVEICRRIWEVPGVRTLGLSTNATFLAPLARDLKQAGVRSVNISLDAMDPAVYRRITGGGIESVFAGISAAFSAGFEVIKLNCVLIRNVNETEYLPLIRFAAEIGAPLRFIELMPLSRTDVLSEQNFLSIGELRRRLASHGEMRELPDYRPGNGPARYFSFEPSGARIGLIGALTAPHFCESCNKLRLTADGKLRPCLGRHGEIDLLGRLRTGEDPAAAIRMAIANKPEDHEFLQSYQPERPMTAIGG